MQHGYVLFIMSTLSQDLQSLYQCVNFLSDRPKISTGRIKTNAQRLHSLAMVFDVLTDLYGWNGYGPLKSLVKSCPILLRI